MTKREEIVAEALSWRGTKYHRRGALKGVGVDCGSFPGMVLVNVGLIPREHFDAVMKEIEALSDDWFLHSATEKYLEIMERFLTKTEERMTYAKPPIDPGNIILMRTWNSKRRNHAAIVTAWPYVVQASYEGVVEVDASRDSFWSFKQIDVFDPVAEKA